MRALGFSANFDDRNFVGQNDADATAARITYRCDQSPHPRPWSDSLRTYTLTAEPQNVNLMLYTLNLEPSTSILNPPP